MAYPKTFVLLITVLVGCAFGAPKPISFEEVGRKVKSVGAKALPLANGFCRFLNSFQGYPMAYPQFGGFPQTGYPGYPPSPAFYPGVPSNTPVWNMPPSNGAPSNGAVPSGGAFEQDDLNNLNSFNQVPRQYVPPQIQQVFKDFNTLSKVAGPAVNTLTNEKLRLKEHLD